MIVSVKVKQTLTLLSASCLTVQASCFLVCQVGDISVCPGSLSAVPGFK